MAEVVLPISSITSLARLLKGNCCFHGNWCKYYVVLLRWSISLSCWQLPCLLPHPPVMTCRVYENQRMYPRRSRPMRAVFLSNMESESRRLVVYPSLGTSPTGFLLDGVCVLKIGELCRWSVHAFVILRYFCDRKGHVIVLSLLCFDKGRCAVHNYYYYYYNFYFSARKNEAFRLKIDVGLWSFVSEVTHM